MSDGAALDSSGAVRVARLETERFVLRALTDADLSWLTEMNGNPDVMRYIRPVDESLTPDEARAAAREMTERVIERFRGRPFGFWAIEEAGAPAPLGWGALKNLDTSEEIEVGYALFPWAWGRGVATEVARRLIRHGFEDLGLDRIVAVTRPENIASQHVLQKAGLHYLGIVDRYYGKPTAYFELLRPEWDAANKGPDSPQNAANIDG